MPSRGRSWRRRRRCAAGAAGPSGWRPRQTPRGDGQQRDRHAHREGDGQAHDAPRELAVVRGDDDGREDGPRAGHEGCAEHEPEAEACAISRCARRDAREGRSRISMTFGTIMPTPTAASSTMPAQRIAVCGRWSRLSSADPATVISMNEVTRPATISRGRRATLGESSAVLRAATAGVPPPPRGKRPARRGKVRGSRCWCRLRTRSWRRSRSPFRRRAEEKDGKDGQDARGDARDEAAEQAKQEEHRFTLLGSG